ncbi:MAG: carbohydrate ABC transporter permease [Treponema sp.]|jgi:putative aldouronate transport system permease protein|nr:carbohydrate ABC transporter permease [Treponema sp.]
MANMSKLMDRGERVFKGFSIVVLTAIMLCAFLPFLLVIIASLTDETALVRNGYSFFPKGWSLSAYTYMQQQANIIFRAYLVSIGVTAVGTAVSLVMTAMLAYPMSRRDFKLRNVFSFIVFFTMLFSGGIVPAYIMWTRIFHINNTYFALLIPNYLMSAFNVLLVRNYFKNNVPAALIESAQIDGASELRIFFRIMLPLAVPVCVTVGLFTGLAYWNDWINALYYVDRPQFYGIQNLLIRMMNNIQFLSSAQGAQVTSGMVLTLPSNGIRMSMAVIGILPILIVYPFLQKYLIRGVVIGAVKG